MDDLINAVSNVHRRRLLVALHDHNPAQDDLDVPEDVHEGERELETLELEFYHCHLPRLADAGVIHWDRETHELERGPRFDEVRPLVEAFGDDGTELPDGSSAQRLSHPSD